nr:hypothetical protein [Gammaproteobacteria bacterium]
MALRRLLRGKATGALKGRASREERLRGVLAGYLDKSDRNAPSCRQPEIDDLRERVRVAAGAERCGSEMLDLNLTR